MSDFEVKDIKNKINSDKKLVSNRALLPFGIHASYGVAAALYVISPAIGSVNFKYIGYVVALAITVATIKQARNISGVKFRSSGPRGWIVGFAAIITVVLGLISSFILKSFNLNWWMILPAVSAFIIVILLSKVFEKIQKESVVRGS